MSHYSLKIILFFVLSVVVTSHSNGQNAVVSARVKNFNLVKGVAIMGYDPVAYFTEGKAVKGNSTNSMEYNGVIYYFTSSEHKELFNSNPTSYEPQYGGWCAYAMGNDGSKVSIDPETFKILAGKLYLFYNFHFVNTLKKWNANESTLRENADLKWSKLIGQ